MIDRFTQAQLHDLVTSKNAPCVTIYLPTETAGTKTQQGAIRLKNLHDDAHQKLSGHWMSSVDATRYLKSVENLIDDRDFWQHTEQGLALFLDADRLRHWRLGASFEQRVAVSDQFFVRPMLRAVIGDDQFYVLALGQNDVRFFGANRTDIDQINVADLPTTMTDFLDYTSVEPHAQVHTGSRAARERKGAVYTGQGGKPDATNDDIAAFYREIDVVVSRYLSSDNRPLILACVKDRGPMYREVNSYKHLVDQQITGGAEELSPHQLWQKAWPIVERHLDGLRDKALEKYRAHADTSKTSAEMQAILMAAHEGRIDSLIVNENASIPGEFNPVNQSIDYQSAGKDFDHDLVELAIAQCIRHRGDVYSVSGEQMPGAAPLVATLRY